MSDGPLLIDGLVPRHVHPRIEAALKDTRVVLIVGPRQAGKSTLARQFTGPARPYVTLDDAAALQAARGDPVGFVRGLKRAVIDEVQRAPELMLAIKESVDRDQEPGRFLLTGSANILTAWVRHYKNCCAEGWWNSSNIRTLIATC